ncbi:MAG: hypothetical protein AAFQ32_04650 [Pseudomonadota bacterium]
MEKTYMTRAIALGRDLMQITGCTPCELREAVPMLMPDYMSDGLDDVTIHLGGNDWRFIKEMAIDTILEGELMADPYFLGCFNAWFIADHSDLSVTIIKALQEGEKFEELGQHLIDTDCVESMAHGYACADGYGHHFASYDGETHVLSTESYYAFNCG